jgi:transcriptional regulator with XRE-family HTH domain
MSKIVYERLPESQSDFRQDVEWARQHPEYWSEKFKLDVATQVAAQLDRLGISQAELARRMGTSPAFVTKILRGYHNWTLETLAKAGVVLGIQWLVSSAPIDNSARAFVRLTDAPPVTPAAVERKQRLIRSDWAAVTAHEEEVTDGGTNSTAAA